MKQVITAGYYDNLAAANEFSPFKGGGGWVATENQVQQPAPTGMACRKLKVVLDRVVTGAGSAYVLTLRVNGADTGQTVSIAAGSSSGECSAADVNVSAGDKINWGSSYTGTPTNYPYAYISIEIESSTANEGIILGNARRSTSTTYYTGLHCSSTSYLQTSDVFNTRSRMPTGGTLKKLYACMDVSDTDALDFDTYKNGSIQTLTCSITSGTCSPDTTHSFGVADGDYVQIRVEENGTIGANYLGWGLVFAPTTDGEFLELFTSSDDPTAGSTEYIGIASFSATSAWGVEEAFAKLLQACTGKKIRVDLATAPGAGKSRTICLRKKGSADTALTVTISDANTTGSTTTDVTISDGDVGVLKHTDSGTPTAAGGIQVSTVFSIAAAATPKSVTDSLAVSEALAFLAKASTTDTLGFTEAVKLAVDALLTDSMSMSDAIALINAHLPLTDSFGMTDAAPKINAHVPLTDSLSVTDALSLLKRIKVTDSMTVSEVLKLVSKIKLTDSMTLSDALAIFTAKLLTDSLSVAESLSLKAMAKVTDSLTVTESPKPHAHVPLTDSLSVTETVKWRGKVIVADTLALAEALALARKVRLTDTLALSEVLSTVASGASKLVSDALSVTEALGLHVHLSMADSLAIADVIGIKDWLKLADSLSVSEQLTIKAMAKITESLAIADSLLAKRLLKVTDSAAISEAVALKVTLAILESLGLTETLSESVQLSLLDSLSIVDVAALAKKILLLDSLGLTETLYRTTEVLLVLNLVLGSNLELALHLRTEVELLL